MGFYNILHLKVKCGNCSIEYDGKIQFKFGHTRQLKYNIGEAIIWKGANDIGIPGIPKIKVYGILEDFGTCPHCNLSEPDPGREYDIFIENDIILGAEEIDNAFHYLEANEGCYLVV